jgi:predicted hotdog family 3-hydroxylacyl-ACP dehydratase
MTESDNSTSTRPLSLERHAELRAKLPFPAADLLPHGEPFALIDTIVEEWDLGGKTTSVVHPDNPLAAADGSTGAETLIEYAAQTCAALDAFQRGDKSFGGLLVEVVDSQYTAVPHVGDTVEVVINVQYDLGKWRGIGYEASVNGKHAAKGTLKLFIINEQ